MISSSLAGLQKEVYSGSLELYSQTVSASLWTNNVFKKNATKISIQEVTGHFCHLDQGGLGQCFLTIRTSLSQIIKGITKGRVFTWYSEHNFFRDRKPLFMASYGDT